MLPNSWFFKTSQRQTRGIPDFIMCVNGFFVAMELKATAKEGLKAATNAMSLQAHFLSQIQKAGGMGIFVYPENWPLVFDNLQKRAEGIIDD